MNTVVDRDLVKRAARAVGWPPVKLGSLVLADEGAWRFALARAQAAERISLLRALEPSLLTATEGGRARLAARRDSLDVDDEPTYIGDPELLGAVKAALALAPPAVRYAALREVAFLGVGISSRGWTASATFVDLAGRRKGRVIVLGPEMDVPAVLHELAHQHLAGPPREESQAVTAQGEAGFHALATAQGWGGRLDKWVRHAEDLADALALAWLYAETEGHD